MKPSFRDYPLAILGGDRRMVELARLLAEAGARVRAAGLDPSTLPVGVLSAPTVAEAAAGALAVLCPLGGTDAEGRIRHPEDPETTLRLDERALGRVQPGCRLVTGRAGPYLRALAERLGIGVIELLDDEEFLLKNAVVTAEGAVELALAHLPVTLHGSSTVVIGLGRCGQQLARLLSAMGARVRAVAFNPVERARAYALRVAACGPEGLADAVRGAHAIFNTAPAPVLGEAVLSRVDRGAVVVDIASAPGGTDLHAARRLGIAVLQVPALPALTAPHTAARVLFDAVAKHLLGEEPGAAGTMPGP